MQAMYRLKSFFGLGLLLIGLAGCTYTSDKPLISADKAARAGPGCLNRFSVSISGASAEVRLPSGWAAG